MVSFRSYPWEGKGLMYYVKDSIRNRPQMFAWIPFYGIFLPAFAYYMWITEDEKRLRKNLHTERYIVIRDDDPRVKDVIKFDDKGNRVFLQPRTN